MTTQTASSRSTQGAGPSRTTGPARRLGFNQRLGRWDVKVSPYLYISPFFVVFAITGLFPLLYTGWVSLHDWDLLGGQGGFVGIDNFREVLGQAFFWKALRNTLSIFLLSSVPQVLMALVLASLLHANLRARTFWRMGVLLPYIVAPVAVTLVFSKMFADDSGMINTILGQLGLDPVNWHSQVLPAHLAIAAMVNFRWTGYNTLIFLAAMQAIPKDVYEAAVIDGAGRLRQFFSVTVPMIRPTVIFVVITSTIGGLQIYDEPRMYDQYGQGGNDRQWLTVTLYMYELGWRNTNLGRAAAVAWLLFIVIVVVALLNNLIARRIASDTTPDTSRRARRARRARLAKSRSSR